MCFSAALISRIFPQQPEWNQRQRGLVQWEKSWNVQSWIYKACLREENKTPWHELNVQEDSPYPLSCILRGKQGTVTSSQQLPNLNFCKFTCGGSRHTYRPLLLDTWAISYQKGTSPVAADNSPALIVSAHLRTWPGNLPNTKGAPLSLQAAANTFYHKPCLPLYLTAFQWSRHKWTAGRHRRSCLMSPKQPPRPALVRYLSVTSSLGTHQDTSGHISVYTSKDTISKCSFI